MTTETPEAPESAPERAMGWPPVLAAIGGALLLYIVVPLVALGGEWGLVNYDDPYLTAPENPAIGKGLLASLPDLLAPSGRFMDAWLPLYYWSLGLDHALFGDWWLGWHLHSGLLHALGAALVVLVARELGLRNTAAATAGLIFALHPVATESVAWIASRKDQLSFVWAAAGALCYLRGVRTGYRRLHVLGALFLGVGLLAKGTVLVLPLLLAVHAVLLRDDGKSVRERLLPVAPFAVVALVLTVVHLVVARSAGTAGAGTGAGVLRLLLADLAVVWLYVRSLFLPIPAWASVEHGLDPFALSAGRMVLGAAVVVAWGGAVVSTWRTRKGVAAVLLAVPLALAPFNNVLPQTSVLFAERYVYVALLPFALGVGAWLASRFGRAAPFLAAALLGVLAAPRIGVWRDSVALWRDAQAVAPASAFVRMQLADALTLFAAHGGERAADWAELAEAEWRGARRLARDDLERVEHEHDVRPVAMRVRLVQAGTGLGTYLLVTASGREDARERVEEAVAVLGESLELLDGLEDTAGFEDRLELALTNRAGALEALGRRDDAFAAWQDAAQRLPERAAPLNAMARLHLAAGRGPDALAALAASARIAPHDAAAARERADIRLAIGDAAGAKKEILTALSEHPQNADLLLVAGHLDLLLLRPVDAEKRFRDALDARPDDEAARTGLASALVQQAQAFAARDDAESAREAARKAAEVAPESSAPDQILGIVARRTGGLDEAVEHFRNAHSRQPDGMRIREALASVLVERAVLLLDDGRDAAALLLVEEALSVGAERIATPAVRLEHGIAGWPGPQPDAASRDVVVRQAALRGLALLADGRNVDALTELSVVDAGSKNDLALRRVALQLLTRAAFGSGEIERALKAAGELPGLADALDDYEKSAALEELAAAWVEAGIARRAAEGEAVAQPYFDGARQVLAAAGEAGLAASRVHLRTGEILFAEEDFLMATREFDRAVELDEKNVDAYLDRAAVWRSHFLIEEDLSFLKGAEEDLRKALAVAPGDARVMAALGETLLLSRKPSEAFPWLQRAVLADPSQTGARGLLAELLVRAGRSNLEKHAETQAAAELDAAESAADRAVALDPPTPSALLLRADVLRTRSRWGDALVAIQRAAERFPDHQEPKDALATYYRDAGHGYMLHRQNSQAIEAFRRALEVEGAQVDLAAVEERLVGIAVNSYNEGLAAREAGDLDRAARQFRLSIRADETPEGWFQLGNALAARPGDDLESLAAAAEAYGRALELRPEFLPALLNRGGVRMRLGRPGEAAQDYRAWLGAAPQDDEHRRAVEHQLRQAERIEREIDEELPGGGDGGDAGGG
jgi:tetratricopeptide (TPR) repeat protein